MTSDEVLWLLCSALCASHTVSDKTHQTLALAKIESLANTWIINSMLPGKRVAAFAIACDIFT